MTAMGAARAWAPAAWVAEEQAVTKHDRGTETTHATAGRSCRLRGVDGLAGADAAADRRRPPGLRARLGCDLRGELVEPLSDVRGRACRWFGEPLSTWELG
jgi:hypothetical protein